MRIWSVEKGEKFTNDLLASDVHLHTSEIANAACRARQRCEGS